MQRLALSRKGFSLIELMILVAIASSLALTICLVVLIWGWGKAMVEAAGANRAYDAVAAAHYVEPELTVTYEDDYAVHCRAADDVAGYGLLATPEDGGERVALTVCCGSTLSSKPCLVRVTGK
ncbi:prepilin-type N-terminal cleavage/methylation domain-containing protein [Candidatus Uhrbacteria bacterium]|nr:prepilin-type N-terminal cleavage/methylation domain-containing protein [Candidatus Uhrbacteria bacterium]